MLNSLNSFIKGFAAKILLVLLIMSFAVWGIGDMVRGPGPNKELVKVGNSTISIGEFSRNLEREKENIQRALGKNYTPDILKSLQIPQQVMQRLINQSLIQQETQARKLIPADSDIARLIHNDTRFHDDKGHFDKARFLNALKNARATEKAYVGQLRNQVTAEILINSIHNQTLAHNTAAKTLYKSRNQQRNLTLYVMDKSLFTAINAPTDEEVKAFYDANHALFSDPEYRTLSYVSFTGEDIKHSITIADAELQSLYNERMDEFRFDARRDTQQLLYNNKNDAQKAHAMATAGKSFEDIATSTDALNKTAIALGKISQTGLFEEAANAVFSLGKNGVTAPISSPFGWHIFKVTSIESSGVKPLSEVKDILEQELRQQKQNERLDKTADDLDDLIAGGSTLSEAAEELGLTLHTLPPVNRSGISPHNVKVQIPDLDNFIETGFSLDEKTESSMRFSDNGSYFVVRTDKVTPAQVKPLGDVRNKVVEAWKNDKRTQKLRALAQRMSEELVTEQGRRRIAQQNNLKIVGAAGIKRDAEKVAGYALPPQLMADIFVRKAGDITLPYELGNNTHIIAAVSGIKQAELPKDTQKRESLLAPIKKELADNSKGELANQYLMYLKQKYPVTINQTLLNSLLQEE